MRRDGKAFTYTPEELNEQAQYWSEALDTSTCREPDLPLTDEQKRLLGLFIVLLQVAEAEEELKDSDCFDFSIVKLWNNKKDGCTVRISENFADRLAYINLKDVEAMLLDHKNGTSAMNALTHCPSI
jgi:hypothetical protein